MNKKAAVLALIVLPALIFAQTSGKVSGVVTDENGAPLAGANVLLVGTTQGTATDAEGQYYLLDVPVGVYSVRSQYIGYKAYQVDNVHVSADLTTWLDFKLEVAALAGEEVVVTAEKPIINLTSTNTNRIIDSEVIENLPLRNVQSLVNLQTGVVDGHVRGSRTGDNAYYVDGVLVRNNWSGGNLTAGISKSGTQEVSVQTGGFSAEYGSANGGVVNITSKSGSDKWTGSFEYVTDVGAESGKNKDGLYSFGYNLMNFDAGGPVGDKLRFYFNVEKFSTLDTEPAFVAHPEVDLHEFVGGQMTNADSLDIWVGGDPDGGLVEGNIYFEEFVRMNQDDATLLSEANATSWGEGLNIDSVAMYRPEWVDTTYLLANNYRNLYGPRKTSGQEKLAFTGNVTLDLKPLKLKFGASFWDQETRENADTYQLLNYDNNPVFGSGLKLGYISGTLALSPKSMIRTTVSLKNYYAKRYNKLYEFDYEDYGRRTTEIGSENYYYRGHGLNTLSVPALVDYAGYGAQWNSAFQRYEDTFGLRTDYLSQVGRHELKAGIEYYDTKLKYYQVSQSREIFQNITSLDANFNQVVDADEYPTSGTPEDWEYSVYRNAYTYNIGYDIFGNETDDYDANASVNIFSQELGDSVAVPYSSNHSQAPGNATTSRFFLSDKIEFRDVVLNLGLSLETFDPHAYAPDSDGDGYGDDAGFDVLHTIQGRIDRSGMQDGSYKWEPIKAYTSLQPRIGFSFPVTDRTVFHAQYGNYWQAPPLAYLFLSDSRLAANLTQGNQTSSPNPTLKPERTTSYEIGFTQQLGLNAALDITGFYKEVRDYVMLKNRGFGDDVAATVDGSEFSWAQYVNGDFGVTQGFAFNLKMRRTAGVMANFSYTTMWARGTGSDPLSNWNITWTGDTYPSVINRLDFDQRHTGSLMVDYRTESKSMLLADLGLNAVLVFGSGQAYTPSYNQSAIYGRGWWTPTAAVNSADLPWKTQLDLRIDKGFDFGAVKLKAYVLLVNALANENVTDVFQSSGQAGEDGYMQTDAGAVWLDSQQTNYPNAPAASLYANRLASFQDTVLDPVRYDVPRMLQLGLQVSF